MGAFIPRGTHIRFAGRGKLVGKQGVTMELASASSNRVKCLFYEPEGMDDIVAHVSPKKIVPIEVDLAYPPISQYEKSYFFVRGWNITMAWNLIRKERRVVTLGRDSIEAYYEAYLKGNDQTPLEMDKETGKWKRFVSVGLAEMEPDVAFADKVDLSIPSLWLKLAHKDTAGHLLIDGRHRLYKAYHQDVQELPAYILSPEEGSIIDLA